MDNSKRLSIDEEGDGAKYVVHAISISNFHSKVCKL
jgi:hypothetical protein